MFASLLAMLTVLTLMIRGLEASFFPIGEALAEAIGRRGDHLWLMGFAFALGFGSTISERALVAVAAEAAGVMMADPALPVTEAQRDMLALQMRYWDAFGLRVALMLAVLRILKGWAISWLVSPLHGADRGVCCQCRLCRRPGAGQLCGSPGFNGGADRADAGCNIAPCQ